MNFFLQSVTLIIVFIIVLIATVMATRFVAGYQKAKFKQENLEVMETLSLTQNKYIQIIRVGSLYIAVGICKDTMTLLGEVNKEDLNFPEEETETLGSFQSILNKMKEKVSDKHDRCN